MSLKAWGCADSTASQPAGGWALTAHLTVAGQFNTSGAARDRDYEGRAKSGQRKPEKTMHETPW